SLTGLSRHAVGAAHMGINLWGNPSLRKMFVLPVAYEMSDGTTPRFGDATTLRPAERWSRLGAFTEPAYSYYKDDSLLPILPPKLSLYSYLYGNENVDRLQKKVGQTVVL